MTTAYRSRWLTTLLAVALIAWAGFRWQVASVPEAHQSTNPPTDAHSARLEQTTAEGLDARIGLLNAPAQSTSSKAEPLPPANTPWGELRSVLTPRIANGDVAAADRLYNDHRRCLIYWGQMHTVAVIDRTLAEGIADPKRRQDALEAKAEWTDLAAKNEALCSQTTRKEIDADNYSVLRNAARAGSERAKECYVFRAMATFESPTSPQLLAEYRELANGYMQEGIAHGSWLMADNMIAIHGGSQRGLGHDWTTGIWPFDLRTAYIYAAVLGTGANNAGNARDSEFYTAILNNISQRTQWSLQDAEAALNEAKLLYARNFADVPYVSPDELQPCGVQ
ncbi:MAG TPA: hypothetical protein VFN29_09170 [Chiayiivirga sp.]|nr:hypothetical protein [Chiayiivirga sp.]